uniref:Sema domain-containing protein n=1 Tax=Trichogramma kaykai TaxID=54128 RepID=A0ABD2W557_9HYME
MIHLLTILLTLPFAYDIIGYDCEARSLNVTTLSLLSIAECDIPHIEPKIEEQYIQLLQLNSFDRVATIQCKVEIHRTIYYCGVLNHLFAVEHGIAEYVHEVNRETCQRMYDSGVYYHGHHMINGMKVNQMTMHSINFAGSALNGGICYRGNYADPYGSWEDVVVQGMVKITVQEQYAKVDLDNNKVHFRSGVSCQFSSEHCIDQEGGNSFWRSLPRDNCNFNRYSILYSGLAERISDPDEENKVYTVTTEDITFRLSARKTDNLCGYSIISTEHPKLFIFETVRGRSFARSSAIDPTNLDLFSYVNSKFVYVERHIKYQLKYLYRDILTERCKLERQTLKNSLAIATSNPDQFAYNFMKGPGFMALSGGEAVHILKCIPIEFRVQHGEKCYNELQVVRGNVTKFLTPKTHILKKSGTEVVCNTVLPHYYLLDDIWYKIMPKPTEANDPITLRPSNEVTWTYSSPKYLASSGIYSSKDLDNLSRAIMFPLEQRRMKP